MGWPQMIAEWAGSLGLTKHAFLFTSKSSRSKTFKDISCVYHKMGLISIHNNNNKLAIKRFEESIQTDKDNAESYFQLSKLTKGKKSTTYLNQAIDIDPEFSIQK